MTVKEVTSGLIFATLAIVLGGCHTGSAPENVIVPVVASVTLQPEPAGAPVVFFRKAAGDIATDDLVTFDVILKPAALLTFDALTLEVRFNPGTIQFANISGGSDGIVSYLGTCGDGTTCQPLCGINTANNSDNVNRTGDLIIGITIPNPGTTCPEQTASAEVTLLTVGFRATTHFTSTSDGTIELADTGTGSSSLLFHLVPLAVPFDDLDATISTN